MEKNTKVIQEGQTDDQRRKPRPPPGECEEILQGLCSAVCVSVCAHVRLDQRSEREGQGGSDGQTQG